MQKHRVRFPISWKLILMSVVMLAAATITIAIRSGKHFQKRSSEREEDTNRSQAKARVDQVDTMLKGLLEKSQVVGTILYRNTTTEAEREKALEFSFRQDKDLVNVEVYGVIEGKPQLLKRVTNEAYLKQYELKSDYIDNLRQAKPFPITAVLAGEIEIRNTTMEGGAPLFTIGLPLVQDDFGNVTNIVMADIRLDKLQQSFAEVRERTTYLLDKQGNVLAHPDEKLAMTGKNLSYLEIVRHAVTSKQMEMQKTFEDPETEEKFSGAYARSPMGVIVVSQIPEDVILEPSRENQRLVFGIAGMVLSAALFFVYFIALRLTTPLEVLVETTKQVASGNFNAKANVTTSDEVGELARAFDQMTEGLKERDRVKTMMGKLHGTGIAEKLLSGEMGLSGEQKYATVFFSDIRGFTAFSENITPHEVVDMLNEYFKVMVSIVTKNKGVVDKFIGDAIMAVWGAPESHGNDAANAVKACLEMRMALLELNESRIARGLPVIKIGMGLHTGNLIAGTIGSDDRMEYTVIGDTVNMASRIEASTKACGTDLLISDVTREVVQDSFIIEFADSVEVKGKTEPLKLYTVLGYYDENKNPVKLETPYSKYKAEKSEKIKTSKDKHEAPATPAPEAAPPVEVAIVSPPVMQTAPPAMPTEARAVEPPAATLITPPPPAEPVVEPSAPPSKFVVDIEPQLVVPPQRTISEKTLVDPSLETAVGLELPPLPSDSDEGSSGGSGNVA